MPFFLLNYDFLLQRYRQLKFATEESRKRAKLLLKKLIGLEKEDVSNGQEEFRRISDPCPLKRSRFADFVDEDQIESDQNDEFGQYISFHFPSNGRVP